MENALAYQKLLSHGAVIGGVRRFLRLHALTCLIEATADNEHPRRNRRSRPAALSRSGIRSKAEKDGKHDVVDDLDRQWMETDRNRQALRAKLSISEDCFMSGCRRP